MTRTYLITAAIVLLALAPSDYAQKIDVDRILADWQFTPGILVPYGWGGHALKPVGEFMSLEGSRRISPAKLEDGYSIYHALVFAPQANCGTHVATNEGAISTARPFEKCKDAAQSKDYPLTLSYDAVHRTLTINSQSFDVSRGNLFVIRVDDNWDATANQLPVILSRTLEPKNVLHAFKLALPHDRLVQSLKP
jgi:hypothetical protein